MTRFKLRAALVTTVFSAHLAAAAFAAAEPPGRSWIAAAHGTYLFPLGAVEQGRWLPIRDILDLPADGADSIAAVMPVGERFDAFTLKGVVGRNIATVRNEDGALFEGQYGILAKSLGNRPVLVASSGSASTPRPARPLSLGSSTYRGFLRTLLAEHGMSVPRPRVTQLYRVDLDGDGRDEVLLAGQSRSSFGMRWDCGPRDYSVAMLRCVVDGAAKTIPLLVGAPGPAADGDEEGVGALFETVEFVAVLDLNGDGRMEFVLRTAYYEGESYLVYEFDGRACRLVLTHGQGA